MALFSFELDPHKILGIPPHASLSEIRDAYRQKAKIHHPDTGGEEWAFRVVVQAYEMLSSARVARAAATDQRARTGPCRAGDPATAPAAATQLARRSTKALTTPIWPPSKRSPASSSRSAFSGTTPITSGLHSTVTG